MCIGEDLSDIPYESRIKEEELTEQEIRQNCSKRHLRSVVPLLCENLLR